MEMSPCKRTVCRNVVYASKESVGKPVRPAMIMYEVADVLSRVNNLEELDVDMFLWPDRYQPSSSLASWQGQNPPNEAKVWDAIEPLKRVQGIRKIVLHAGAEATRGPC